jgi:hypothetical protein
MIRIAFPIAYLTFQAISVLAQNATCRPGPCVAPEVIAWESSECQQYHIFVARGSDSSYPGHQGPLVNLICQGLEDCGYENIIYPANSSSTGPGNWCKSAHKGAINGQKQLRDYAERCPDSKLILTGFSQGGSVVLDIIGGGGGGPGFDCEYQEPNDPLSIREVPGSNSKYTFPQHLVQVLKYEQSPPCSHLAQSYVVLVKTTPSKRVWSSMAKALGTSTGKKHGRRNPWQS